jgi:hypothetical protein
MLYKDKNIKFIMRNPDGMSGWVNVRWTGVLEKKEGKWLIRQMHFSFPLERFR